MAARLCKDCNYSWPDSVDYDPCPSCGRDTARQLYVSPMGQQRLDEVLWEVELGREIAADFYWLDRRAELVGAAEALYDFPRNAWERGQAFRRLRG